MAIGIGQQIKGMVNRARNYWSDLTEGATHRGQSGREDVDEEVHQRYGSNRDTAADSRLRERQASMQGRATRGETGAGRNEQRSQAGTPQPGGGQGHATPQMQADSQTGRQYTQQGGSGIQKTLNEQMEGGDDKAGGRSSGRPPGQRR